MAEKFNRNDPNAADDKFYLDDYRVDINGLEAEALERLRDFEVLPCILNGLDVTPITGDYTRVQVAAGSAYDADGHKIVVPVAQTVDLVDTTDNPNHILLRYATVEDTPREAYLTGTTWNTRIQDSFQIVVTTTAPSSADVVLATVTSDGTTTLTVDTSLRTNPVAKPRPTDPNPPSQPTITNVTTGPDIPVEQPQPLAMDMHPPRTAYVDVDWTASTDASGIAHYRVLWVPYAGGIPQMSKATEYRTSGTYLRIRGIPIGERGRIWLTTVDRAGNASPWVESQDITAGVGTGLTQPPQITLTRQKGAVYLTIQPDPAEAASVFGYEVYVHYGSPPQVSKEYLFYTGPAARHRIPAGEDPVYVVVRAYDSGGTYSPEVSAASTPVSLFGQGSAGQPRYCITVPVNHTFSVTGTAEEVGQVFLIPYGGAVIVKALAVYRTDDLSNAVTLRLVGLEAAVDFSLGTNNPYGKATETYMENTGSGFMIVQAIGTAGDTFSGYIHLFVEPV
ncbi:MAG: hypothetical protein L3J76_05475 [Candidatus Hydrothermae bacterium]|nr:hypothetical protein [Candidatus Hydrothermae bacterium]